MNAAHVIQEQMMKYYEHLEMYSQEEQAQYLIHVLASMVADHREREEFYKRRVDAMQKQFNEGI